MKEYKHLIIDKPGICYAVVPSTMARDYLLRPAGVDDGFWRASHTLDLVLFASFDWELTLRVRNYFEKFDHNSEIINNMTGVKLTSANSPKFDVIHLNCWDDYWQYVDDREQLWQPNENKVHQNEIMDFISVHGLFNLYFEGSRESCQRQHEKDYGLEFINKIRVDFNNLDII